MITNERQYKISKRQAEQFRTAVREFDELEMIKQGIDPIIVAAQRVALTEQLGELERDIDKYERLSSGEPTTLLADDVAELGTKFIEARIAQGLSQRDLAERLNMKEQQIQRYEQDRYSSASLSRIAEVANALKLTIQSELEFGSGDSDTASSGFDASKLPVKEMKKRGWLKGPTTGGIATDVQLAMAFVLRATQGPQLRALHKQSVRAGSQVDAYALLAWKARVLEKAAEVATVQKEYPSLDGYFIQSLVNLSCEEDGPVKAVRMLRDRGVAVVFEEHLKSTHLDGAAMLLNNSTPVIGLTLRHDRLDNFWFVLLHEVAHVVCHRDQGLRDGFFDDESAVPLQRVEQEADDFAQNALLPMEAWMNSFVRYSKSREDIAAFARKHKISPAIVSGRIRRERKDYTMFSDLVGQGRLKRMMVAAGFMEGANV